MYNYLCLGQNLKELRKKKKLTIQQVATLLRASESSLRSVEAGHRYFSIQRLCKAANTFQVSMDELLKENGKESSFEENRQAYEGSYHQELLSLLDDADDHDVKFILDVYKDLQAFKNSQHVLKLD